MSPPAIEPLSILWFVLWGAATYGVCRMALDLHNGVAWLLSRRRRRANSVVLMVLTLVSGVLAYWAFIIWNL